MMTSAAVPRLGPFDAVSSSGGPVGIRAASLQVRLAGSMSRLIGDPPLSGVGEIWWWESDRNDGDEGIANRHPELFHDAAWTVQQPQVSQD